MPLVWAGERPDTDRMGSRTDRPTDLRTDRRRSRLVGIAIGAAVGGIAGLIVAVNLVITFGPDQGYESSIGEVFEHNVVLGLVVVGIVVAGPLTGILMARRMQQSQRRDTSRSDR